MTNTPEKLRGGYYTPPELAKFLAEWLAEASPRHVLEPSAGDGNLVAAMAAAAPDAFIHAVELMDEEADKIKSRGLPQVTVTAGDVFRWWKSNSRRYDAVIGNPPFIRYQTWPEEYRGPALDLMRSVGLNPNRMTNAWVPFIVLATEALRAGGRMALVVPAELLQVSYAGEIRSYLATHYESLEIVTFKSLVFKGILQETVLLLGVRSENCVAARIEVLEAADEVSLKRIRGAAREASTVHLDHAREKWTQYYLDSKELGLLRSVASSEGFCPMSTYANVNVGIVTGRNEFFVLRPSEARARGVLENCIPLVGRSNQLAGLDLKSSDFQDLSDRDEKCLLLQLGKVPFEYLSRPAQEYVRSGEERGFDTGYKLRIRKPTWWNVPSAHASDGFMLRQIYDGPRLISNSAGVLCTDTIHRVFSNPGHSISDTAVRMMNSATFAFTEVHGRSYGGGVLELEPSEARGLPLPCGDIGDLDLEQLDRLARSGGLPAVLDEVDRTLLGSLGLTAHEQALLRAIWIKLRDRRMNRG